MTAPRVKLDIDATREKLGALGLSHAVEALEGLLSDAVRSEMPAHAFLERLLDAERSGREERRVRTMLKTAKIPTGVTLENFDFAFQPAIERSLIETLATGAWIRGGEVVLMQGPPGVGKSHLLCGLGIGNNVLHVDFRPARDGPIRRRRQLGGIITSYSRDAA